MTDKDDNYNLHIHIGRILISNQSEKIAFVFFLSHFAYQVMELTESISENNKKKTVPRFDNHTYCYKQQILIHNRIVWLMSYFNIPATDCL